MSSRARKRIIFLSGLSLTIAACLCTSALPFGGGDDTVVVPDTAIEEETGIVDETSDEGDIEEPPEITETGPTIPCILTQDEVSAAIGTPVIEVRESDEKRCRYDLDDGGAVLTTIKTSDDSPDQVRENFLSERESVLSFAEEFEDISGVGDGAFWQGELGILNGYSGTTRFELHYPGPDPALVKEGMIALASSIADQLP